MKNRNPVTRILGCLALALFPGGMFAQAVVPQPTSTPTGPVGEDVTQLSPFEVVENNNGYYAANTMSGTRVNSKIEDLGASITVVTKEQMADFAMLGIHDLFAYEANTEGMGNYTEMAVDQNGAVTDSTTLSPQDANRIRGIGAANITFGNFETSGRVPIDPIDVDAVEISRGPNSSIFGIGNTAGTVNSVPASAGLSKNRSEVTTRVDSNEGYRTTLDLNRVFVPGRLAARGSVVYQHDESHLKPSGMNTVRLHGMVKYRPFKNTTLSGSIASYRAHGTRANTLTPSDGVSAWLVNGKAAYDPITNTATVNGASVPVAGVTAGAYGNIHVIIDRGQIEKVQFGRATDPVNLVNNLNPVLSYKESVLANPYPNQPLFLTALPVTNRSIYDWLNVNLGSANRYQVSAETSTATLDQIFLSTPRQKLAAQLGVFRERTRSDSRIIFGIPRNNPNSTTLAVDINAKLLDGTPNPNFGRPYLSSLPYSNSLTTDREDYRAQLAYHLDLRAAKGWPRWLGAHDLSSYAEYKNVIGRSAQWRDTITSNHSWFPSGVTRGANAGVSIGGAPGNTTNILSQPSERFFVGDAVGGNVDYGPAYFHDGRSVIIYGGGTGKNFVTEPVTIGPVVGKATGIGGNNWSILKSRGVVWQGHLLDDRIVTTFGWRHDESNTRIGGQLVSPDGMTFDYDSFNSWAPGDWTTAAGPTKTAGLVVKPLRWLSFYWNKSDSFRPSAPKQDLYLNKLPDPKGVGKDFGVMVNLFSNRLVLRFNRYITRQLKAPNGTSATYVSRIRRMDFTDYDADSNPGTDAFTLQTVATNWVLAEAAAQGRTLTSDQIKDRLATIMKLPRQSLGDPEFANGAGDDTLARGFEFEANYNPVPAWTMKLNVTKTETLNEKIAPELRQWITERLPVWQSIIDPTTGKPWFTSTYGSSTSVAANSAIGFYQANVISQIDQLRATEGQVRPQIRKYRANFSTNFRLSGITENRVLKRFNVGGAVRWEDKGAIGYYGAQQPPAIVTSYDLTRPIYDKGHTYIDLLLGYRARLFNDRVSTRFQLNVRNVQEDGRLQPVAAFPNGQPYAYRIIEPRVFIASAAFDY